MFSGCLYQNEKGLHFYVSQSRGAALVHFDEPTSVACFIWTHRNKQTKKGKWQQVLMPAWKN